MNSPAAAEVRPTYWQVEGCPDCGAHYWATPWEPRSVCVKCGRKLTCLPVYLPWNPGGSEFGLAKEEG